MKIGRRHCVLLAERGARVGVSDISREAGETAAAALRDSGLAGDFVAVDLTDADSVTAFAQQVQTEFGPVDILVNAAGWGSTKPFWEGTPDLWDKLIALNFVGPMRLAKALLPAMLERKSGSIVCISSVSAQRGGGIFGGPHYSAAKAGVLGLATAMVREFGADNIRVNCITPGLIATDINKGKIPEDTRAGKFLAPAPRAGPPRGDRMRSVVRCAT